MKKMSAVEVAKVLGVSHTTVYNWVKKGCPHTVKRHGLRQIRKFSLDEVKKWVSEQGGVMNV